MPPAISRIAALTAAADWPVLAAPPHWRVVDFISDLHLQASEPANFLAWQGYMRRTKADAVFILGDLFEVWVGDDGLAAGNFEDRCVQTLRAAASQRAIFFLHGNRDFLLGTTFAQACAATLLADPTVLSFAGQRWLLSHGDALCLGDTEYLQFRAQVRSAGWQRDFLDKPLVERKAIAQGLRQQSEARKRSGIDYADVDADVACAWLHAAQATAMIHGHTHKPADHDLGQGLQRIVLSDWDAAAAPPRAEVLRLSTAAPGLPSRAIRQRISPLAA